MSKVLVAEKRKKKKLNSNLKDVKARGSTVEGKKKPRAKVTNWDVFEMDNFLTENTDENLEIFYQKGMRKSSLPSIKALLSSSNKDSGISSLNNSIGQSQRSKIQKYTQKEDIFITKIAKPTINTSKQFNNDISSPLDRNVKKSHDYSISAMFSDGLSQENHFGQRFNYASDPDNSQTDRLLPAINVDSVKVGDTLAEKLEGKKEKEIQTNLRENSDSRQEPSEHKSKSHRKNFGRNKQQKETLISYGIANSSGANKELCSIEAETNSSRTSFLASLLGNAIDKIQPLRIENYDKNEEPCVVCEEENWTSSPMRSIDKRSKAHSKENSLGEIITDIELNDSQSQSINITLSDCNLDHSINSEDCDDRSIKMIHRKAEWYMNQASGSTEITCDVNENLRHTGLMLNFNKNDSVIGFAKADNTLQNASVEFLDIGSRLSCQSNGSLIPHLPVFDLSQNGQTSFEERNLIHQESRHSSFNIPQSLYIRQRSCFFNQRQTPNKKTDAFNFCSWTEAKNVESLPISQNRNYTCGYDSNDGNKENETSIFDTEKQCIGHKDFGPKVIGSSVEKLASSNYTKKSRKRHYPFDRNSEFFNVELNDACNMCEREKQAAKNLDKVQNTGSRDRTISIDRFSCSSFSGLNISPKNRLKRSPSNGFWNISHRVQTFVKGWLDTDDEIGDEISSGNIDRKNLSPKRRRVDIDNEGREKGIDIDPKLLLSNYSCEYDRPCINEHFKPKVK